MTQIVVPTLGESVTEATVAQWLKEVGEAVKIDEPLVELETDKVTLEVNAPASGVITNIIVPEGDTVEVGSLLGEMEEGGAPLERDVVKQEQVDTKRGSEKAAYVDVVSKKDISEDKDVKEAEAPKTSPAVRKLLADHGLDTSVVPATGKDGRLTKADVQKYLESGAQKKGIEGSAPEALPRAYYPEPAGPREERVQMSKLRQVIAKRLKEAQDTAAMLTTFNEIDMEPIMALRKEYKDLFEKKHGIKLGFMSFFVKAVVQALKEFPAINAEIDGAEIVYKNYYNIGVAVSTPQGLVVPVIRDADRKSMAEIESNIADFGVRARDGKLSMDELVGGTYTITNGGVFGSLMSTPILNTPQSGILGMHSIQKRPVVAGDGSIEARSMMYVAQSYDHRIVDGREAVSSLVRIKQLIEDPRRLVLDI
ncbi:MAG: 2-oxoglutarate dehydrogenase complex dihydrolipoyllysine-residue succinyltransferase [Alphaproteobacteria bacterium]